MFEWFPIVRINVWERMAWERDWPWEMRTKMWCIIGIKFCYRTRVLRWNLNVLRWGGGNKGLEVGPFLARSANPFQTHKIVLLGVANGANLLLLPCLVLAVLFLYSIASACIRGTQNLKGLANKGNDSLWVSSSTVMKKAVYLE